MYPYQFLQPEPVSQSEPSFSPLLCSLCSLILLRPCACSHVSCPLLSFCLSSSREETLQPVLYVFAKFRDGVRTAARAGDVSELLRLCDQVRDDDLADIGVRLEDRAEGRCACVCVCVCVCVVGV